MTATKKKLKVSGKMVGSPLKREAAATIEQEEKEEN